MDKDNKQPDKNITRYGEFVPSFDAWTNVEEQKKKTKKLENISAKKDKKN